MYTETYGYDGKSRITSVTSAGATFTLDYDATDHLAALHLPSGVVTSYGYDVRDRLASIETRNAGNQLLMRWAYTRSGAGDILTSTDEAGRTHEYSYDSAGRLTEDVVRTSTAVLWAEGFAYDSVGNRTIRYYSPPNGATVTEASGYDARDRLTSAGAAALSWDEDGRMLSRSGPQGYTLGWDSQDRLRSVQYADGSRLDNTYDGDGVRVGFVETPVTGTATVTSLLVSRARPLSHVVAELTPQGALQARYLRAADKMLAVFRGSERRDFVADQIGSTRAMLASGGAVTDRWEYFAFGAVRTHSGADDMRYMFAGEPFESHGLLSQNRARWLDVGAGQFLSQDPHLPVPHRPLALARYSYAEANPVSRTDPSGELSLVSLTITVAISTHLVVAATHASIEGTSRGLAAEKKFHTTELAMELQQIMQRPIGGKARSNQWWANKYGDAIRHCTASCVASAWYLGIWPIAYGLANVFEFLTGWNWCDEFNNSVGSRFGFDALGTSECYSLCESSADQGELAVGCN